MLGPFQTGKTMMIAALQHHVDARLHRIVANDRLTTEMFHCGAEIVRGWRAEGNNTVETFRFELTTTRRRFGLFPEVVCASFEVVDAAGGIGLPVASSYDAGDGDPAHRHSTRARLLEQLRESEGILLCVDAFQEQEEAPIFFRELPTLLAEIDRRPVPFDRVAICLTRCDRLVAHAGDGAEALLASMDPLERAERVLTRHGIQTLKTYLKPTARVAVGFSSVFGFVGGAPNHSPEHTRLRTTLDEESDAIDLWRPYRLLDPFVFLATGNPGTMRAVRASEL